MAFWLGILVAALIAASAVKLGFYQSWTLLFNLVIAVYIAIHLNPIVAEMIPAAADTAYCKALCALAVAVAAFLILHGIAYVFFIGQFNVTFPRILETMGSGFLGFLAGFLIWSFAALLISTTPLSENSLVNSMGFDARKFEEAKMQSYLLWWCNLLDTVAISDPAEQTSKDAVIDMLKAHQGRKTVQPSHQPATERPPEPNDVNTHSKKQGHTTVAP